VAYFNVCGGYNYFKSGSKFKVDLYVIQSLVRAGKLIGKIGNDGFTWYYLTA
jgi:hypothetical protein